MNKGKEIIKTLKQLGIEFNGQELKAINIVNMAIEKNAEEEREGAHFLGNMFNGTMDVLIKNLKELDDPECLLVTVGDVPEKVNGKKWQIQVCLESDPERHINEGEIANRSFE